MISFEQSVEEALCFGWVDSLIKKLDEERYAQLFTPRKDNSKWSASNIKRIEKLINENKMAEAGLARVNYAKEHGLWNAHKPPAINTEILPEFEEALNANKEAKVYFDSLAPSHKKQYILWINSAKRDETKIRRIEEAISMLQDNKKLGMK